MNRDDITRMAREAGISKPWDQEPVKWETLERFANLVAAAEREWQGLTDDDINDHWITAMCNTEGTRLPIPEFARAIEAKLKEKNSG
jgi:hypothetical protein